MSGNSDPFQTKDLSIDEVINRIEKLNIGLAKFWSNAAGWAPLEAAGLLTKSRLDWQVSMSQALRLWTTKKDKLTDGELILAWVNLGTLIEGTLKILISVYYLDYKNDLTSLKHANALDLKKKVAIPPDELALDRLRKFVKEAKLLDTKSDETIELVQKRRNAVHAFKDRPIGDEIEFQTAIRSYLGLLRVANDRLPYPDDNYVPHEI